MIIGRSTREMMPDRETMNEAGVVLLVDKPADWTSFDVVHKIRNLFRLKKVGHAGTLDPKATGLLIVCTGKQTRSVEQFSSLDKEYVARMTLGKTSASYDTETEILTETDPSFVSREMLENVLREFRGKQMQVPPMYSAVKRGGKPLYKYARKGRTVQREPREVDISAVELLEFQMPSVVLRVRCSKGTYIRSLVHDIGQRLGCGALLAELRRTAIGPYRVEEALTIEELAALQSTQRRTVNEHDARHVTA